MRFPYATASALVIGIGLGAGAVHGLRAEKAPPTYFVAEIDVKDHERYMKEFAPRAEANIKAFGGRILAATAKVGTLEGAPPSSRVVLISWDGIEKVQSWRNATESKELQVLGHKYATFRSYIVEGVP